MHQPEDPPLEIQITEENFLKAREKLKEQKIEVLLTIAKRFKISNLEGIARQDLIDKIVRKIKNVMISRYKPESYEKLDELTNLLVNSLIVTSSGNSKPTKSKP